MQYFLQLWIFLFFSLSFDLFSIIAKEVDQIRNNVVCVVTRLIFLFCCALTMGRCNVFQHIFVNYKKSEFYGPYFQAVLFLVTVISSCNLKGMIFTPVWKKSYGYKQYLAFFNNEWSFISVLKMGCRVKTNTTWTTKNTTSSHYFSKKLKTNTLENL